jgi:hypothetical protein
VSVALSTLALTQEKWCSTFEVYFWRKKQQERHAFDQPRSPSPNFVLEDRLVGAEASLTLTEEVDVSSLGCEGLSGSSGW